MKHLIIRLLFLLNLSIFPVFYLQAQINFLEIPFEELIAQAKLEKKPVFIFLSNNNNESRWLESDIFNNQTIGNYYNANFICGKFYGHINYSNLRSDKINVKKYPFLIYYHPEMDKSYSISGGLSIEKLLTIGKLVGNEFKLLDVINHQLNPIDDNKAAIYKIPDNDGRYTLGVRGKRLMYGYPYPNSTSHFSINVNGKMASNSPRFLISRDMVINDYLEKKGFFARMFKFIKGKKRRKTFRIKSYDNVTYLNDTLLVSFDESNAMHSNITFRFNGLNITQKLSPLNENLEACKENDSTRYYQSDYIFENDTSTVLNVGLLALFDTMIDNNDGAQMDAFKTDLLEQLNPNQKKEAAKQRGKYAKYTKSDGLKRILVYRDSKLTKSLTGDFRFVTDPDEIHVGPWPGLFSVLWDIPQELKLGQRYYDSAVLLKWYQQSIAPGDKYYFSGIFGLYNKGILDLVPSGTNFAGTDSTGKRIRYIAPELKVEPDTIFVGESANLKWKVENPLNADIYISAKPKLKQRNQGNIVVKPANSTVYYLQMLENGKEIASTNAKLVVLQKQESKKISFDGKFTIGIDNQPLIFGYPFPYSTSNFQFFYNKRCFSNNKLDNNSIYLAANQRENIPNDKKNIVTYENVDFEITQSLIPLNNYLKKTIGDSASFLQCEYSIKNISKSKGHFVFNQILDLSFFIVDSMELKLNGKPSKFNRIFNSQNIPKEILLSDKSQKQTISISTLPFGGQKPSSLSIGDWHFLKNMDTKNPFPDTSFYQNPAILINWDKIIAPNESVKFAYIIGSQNNGKLKYFYNQAEEIKSMSINFETNKATIKKSDIEEIEEFIRLNQFDFIVLEGFSDNRGALSTNYQLAQKRIESIKKILLTESKVDAIKILKKVHGEIYSNLKSNYKDVDDIEERKVKITLFRKRE